MAPVAHKNLNSSDSAKLIDTNKSLLMNVPQKQLSRQMGPLYALQKPNGRVIAFHTENMQVARLSKEAWEALAHAQSTQAQPENELALLALRKWQDSVNPNLRKETKEIGVRALTINVTQVCNLQCRYCAAGGDGSYGDPIKKIIVSETIPALQNFLKQVPSGQSFQLTFLGGEPLLYPDGIRILAEEATQLAKDLGIKLKMTVVTNGTLFSAANIALLKKFGMNITVSLDGPAEVNDQRRPTKSGRAMTQTIIEGLQLLLKDKAELGQIMLSGVFGQGNLNLMSAYHFYRQFDVDWMDFTYDHHETSTEVNEKFIQELLLVAEYAYRSEGERGLRRIHTFDRWINSLDAQQQTENYCGAGKSFLMMDAKQNLYTCPWVVGQADEMVGRGAETWQKKLEPYAKTLVEQNGCQNCFARFLCGGGCMYIHKNATGDKHKVDKNFCHRTQTLIEQTLLYYEEMRAYEKSEYTNEN